MALKDLLDDIIAYQDRYRDASRLDPDVSYPMTEKNAKYIKDNLISLATTGNALPFDMRPVREAQKTKQAFLDAQGLSDDKVFPKEIRDKPDRLLLLPNNKQRELLVKKQLALRQFEELFPEEDAILSEYAAEFGGPGRVEPSERVPMGVFSSYTGPLLEDSLPSKDKKAPVLPKKKGNK